MKKTLISLAVAAGLVVSGAASADAKLYGFIDVSLNSFSDATNLGAPGGGPKLGTAGTGGSANDMGISSNTSAIGVKGSEDLGGGMKALYKMEFQIDVMNRLKTITDRDQWVGIKGGMGTVKVGTMSSNYKQMGGKIDPFYRTAVQARSVGMQSELHQGAGIDGGRMTNAIQYSSPKMGGMQLILNTTFSGDPVDEASGIGFRYNTKSLKAWVDLLMASGNTFKIYGSATTFYGDSMKVGASFKVSDALTVGGQYEIVDFNDTLTPSTGDLTVMFLSAKYKMGKNNTVAVSYGSTEDTTAGFTLGLWHKLSKQTSAYVAFNSMSEDTLASGPDGSVTSFGLRKKF